MSGIFQNLLQDAVGAFFGSDYLRDYTHASKTFRTNNYENAPKLKFLFHVYFDVNLEALPNCPNPIWGLLVKTIRLPSYTFATHEMNQYNRKRIVQTKIKYDPIEIDFHDDNGDMIRKLWYNYYTYYYKDATHIEGGSAGSSSSQILPGTTYNERTLYQPSITGYDDWGYTGEPSSTSGGTKKPPFFKNITIFGMNRHNFSAYTLINPIITRFGHDTYSYADSAGIMENKMTIDYETVKYYSGAIAGQSPGAIMTGFGAEANYDRTKSPISIPGSQNSILGPNGLVDGGLGVLNDLQNGTFSLNTLKTLGTTIKTASSMNLKQAIISEGTGLATQALVVQAGKVDMNRNLLSTFPSFPGVAGTPPTNVVTTPAPVIIIS